MDTWKVRTIDLHPLLLSILSYLAPRVSKGICYLCKNTFSPIYYNYTLKNCWVFHPHYFECFPRVHIRLWVNDLCDWMFYLFKSLVYMSLKFQSKNIFIFAQKSTWYQSSRREGDDLCKKTIVLHRPSGVDQNFSEPWHQSLFKRKIVLRVLPTSTLGVWGS